MIFYEDVFLVVGDFKKKKKNYYYLFVEENYLNLIVIKQFNYDTILRCIKKKKKSNVQYLQ
jgi:hypothetical protein